MSFSSAIQNFITDFKRLHSTLLILDQEDKMQDYQIDESSCKALVTCPIVFPKNTENVQSILRLANTHSLAIVPRGAGSGLNGGCVPIMDSVIVCMEHMNQILEIDQANFTATVQPGLITGDIRKAVEPHGLFYPPVPASVDYCSIGGNIATNAGGLCAVKYGVTREYVLGLEVVMASGDVIQTSGPWVKCSTGYDLTQLFTGSEGTLGIVTKIILKLIPLPKHRQTLLLPFSTLETAAQAVQVLLQNNLSIPTMELIPKEAVQCVKNIYDYSYPFEGAAASLLIELDGFDEATLEQQTLKLYELTSPLCSEELLMAQSESQREELWLFRKSVRNSIVAQGEYVEADSVVARNKISNLLLASRKISTQFKVKCISYGHAGDGNLHTYFLKENIPDPIWSIVKHDILQSFFEETQKLGGTLSGEHGIGLDKVDYMSITHSDAHLTTMKKIKKALDPNNRMNPGKVLAID